MEDRQAAPSGGLRSIIESVLARSEPPVPVGEDSARRLRELIDAEDSNSEALRGLVVGECAFAAEILRAAHSPLFGGLSTLREEGPTLFLEQAQDGSPLRLTTEDELIGENKRR